MNICTDTRGNNPQAIAMRLKADIETQKLERGSRLLPLRKLAGKYDASYFTMHRAVNMLCEEGILASRHGSGVYVNQQDVLSSKSQTKVKKKTISIVFCGAGKYVVEQGTQYTRLLHGIEKEAAKQGMDVVMTMFRNADEFIETGIYNSASGFLLVGDDTDSLENIFKGKTAVQVMGSGKKWGDHISYDNKTIGILAANYFASKGYKQLVCINVHKRDGDERCRMFKEHAEYLGVNVAYFNNPNALIKTDIEQHIEFDFLKECVDKIENTSPRPQGVFVVDLVAQPLYGILLERGIKPGRDIEIATCNWRNTMSAGGQYSPLNIDQRPEDVGMMAVRQLQWRMGNPEAKRMVIKIDPEILD